MIKKTCQFFLIASLFTQSLAMADISCPQTITCNSTSADSCGIPAPWSMATKTIVADTYTFSWAQSYPDEQGGRGNCGYSTTSGNAIVIQAFGITHTGPNWVYDSGMEDYVCTNNTDPSQCLYAPISTESQKNS